MSDTLNPNMAADFATAMQALDFRKPDELHAGMHNLKFAVTRLLVSVTEIEERLAADDDELASLRMIAISLAEHVLAGRQPEAKEAAKVILSWYEEGDDTDARGDDGGDGSVGADRQEAPGPAPENTASNENGGHDSTEEGADRDCS